MCYKDPAGQAWRPALTRQCWIPALPWMAQVSMHHVAQGPREGSGKAVWRWGGMFYGGREQNQRGLGPGWGAICQGLLCHILTHIPSPGIAFMDFNMADADLRSPLGVAGALLRVRQNISPSHKETHKLLGMQCRLCSLPASAQLWAGLLNIVFINFLDAGFFQIFCTNMYFASKCTWVFDRRHSTFYVNGKHFLCAVLKTRINILTHSFWGWKCKSR